jgi:hypothetical protein
MIHYSVVPEEQIFEGMDDFKPQYEEIRINGCIMQVQQLNGHEAQIVRLISPNPQDYLNPAYAPGQTIKFSPFLPVNNQ